MYSHIKTAYFFLLIISVFTTCSSSRNLTYQSDTLEIKQLTANTFLHISCLNTESFGKVSCNGLVYVNKGEAVVFDTPVDKASSKELIDWIKSNLKAKVTAVVINHFHEDCLGGLSVFHKEGVKSYSSLLTQELARKDSLNKPTIPQLGFDKELILKVGDKQIINSYLGEGHTRDNIVSYIPSEKVLFGGCVVKELNATKGNLADANPKAWPQTIEKIKNTFPNAVYIVPGHGKYGDRSLLDYTAKLFENN